MEPQLQSRCSATTSIAAFTIASWQQHARSEVRQSFEYTGNKILSYTPPHTAPPIVQIGRAFRGSAFLVAATGWGSRDETACLESTNRKPSMNVADQDRFGRSNPGAINFPNCVPDSPAPGCRQERLVLNCQRGYFYRDGCLLRYFQTCHCEMNMCLEFFDILSTSLESYSFIQDRIFSVTEL